MDHYETIGEKVKDTACCQKAQNLKDSHMYTNKYISLW